MKKTWIILTIIICALVVMVGYFLFFPKNEIDTRVVFNTSSGKVYFYCRTAEDNSSRIVGLSNTDSLEEDHAMLFIYDSPKPLIFTMKDMNYPLDIIFINHNYGIINIVEAEVGQEHISSNGSAQYVVEINQGLCKQNNIKIGTIMQIQKKD